MRAGKLRHRIIIKQPTEVQSDTGDETLTWSTLATVWASVEPIRGREQIMADASMSECTHRIRLRYVSGLTTQCRIEHKSRTIEIVHIGNINDVDAEYELMCKEAVS